jgi:hypothetical protein
MDRCGLPLIRSMADEYPFHFGGWRVREGMAEPFESRRGSIRGAVIHDDDFHAIEKRAFAEQAQAIQAWGDKVLLIIGRNQYRE